MTTNNEIFFNEKINFLNNFNKQNKNKLEEIENLHKKKNKENKKQNLKINTPFQIASVTIAFALIFNDFPNWIIYICLTILLIIWAATAIKICIRREDETYRMEDELIFQYLNDNICNIKMIDDEKNCQKEDCIYFKYQNKAIELIQNSKLFENFNSLHVDGIYAGKYKNVDFEYYDCEIFSKDENNFTGTIYNIKFGSEYKNITFSKESNTFNVPRELIELLKKIETEKTLKHYFDENGNLIACLDFQVFNSALINSDTTMKHGATVLLDRYLTQVLFVKKIIDTLKP